MTGGVPVAAEDVEVGELRGDPTAPEADVCPPTARALSILGPPPTPVSFISGTMRAAAIAAASSGCASIFFFLDLMQKTNAHIDKRTRIIGMTMPIATIAGNGGRWCSPFSGCSATGNGNCDGVPPVLDAVGLLVLE
jgi:hypothetical protein